MIKSAVNTYIFNVCFRFTKGKPANLFTDFSSIKPKDIKESPWDLIDMLEHKLQDPHTFEFGAVRFGNGTAAAPYDDGSQQLELALSEETAGFTTDESQDKPKTERRIRLTRIIDKGYWQQGDTRVAKYLHFEVEYGENGDAYKILKDGEKPYEVTPEAEQVRTYNIIVAFANDPESKNGVVFFESRAQHSIISPARVVLRKAFEPYGGKLKTQPFADEEAINRAVKNGRVKKLRLITKGASSECAEAMQYKGREIVYLSPSGHNFAEKLLLLISSAGHDCRIDEIKEYNPDTIKLQVEGDSGRNRTYTIGGAKNGTFQELLDDSVIGADGKTNPDKFRDSVKEIFFESHI